MPQTNMGFDDIVKLVRGLSEKHLLESRPQHTPGGLERVREFVRMANTQFPDRFQEGKNREMRLKDALIDANQKFRQNPELDELNVLFVACGDFTRMSEWHGNLMGAGGFFTGESFHPPETYRNVDCVILSNLKYRHSVAFNFPAWSLDDVLLIPIINPHRRAQNSAVVAGCHSDNTASLPLHHQRAVTTLRCFDSRSLFWSTNIFEL